MNLAGSWKNIAPGGAGTRSGLLEPAHRSAQCWRHRTLGAGRPLRFSGAIGHHPHANSPGGGDRGVLAKSALGGAASEICADRLTVAESRPAGAQERNGKQQRFYLGVGLSDKQRRGGFRRGGDPRRAVSSPGARCGGEGGLGRADGSGYLVGPPGLGVARQDSKSFLQCVRKAAGLLLSPRSIASPRLTFPGA